MMSTHVHYSGIAGEHPMRRWLLPLHTGMGAWFQRRRLRTGEADALGAVFAERPTERLVPLSAVPALIAYHHNNPVRAGVVARATESSSLWTSHRAYVGLDARPAWLAVDRGLELAGLGGLPERVQRAAFDTFVEQSALGRESIDAAEAARAWRIEHGSAQPVSNDAASDGPAATRTVDACTLVDVVARMLGLSREAITTGGRDRRIVFARRVAVHAWAKLTRPLSEIAAALRLRRSAVSNLLHRPAGAEVARVADAALSLVVALQGSSSASL